MKKVKVLLTAITVFAVVGGALAFKAKESFTFYTSDGTNVCNIPTVSFSTTESGTIPVNATLTATSADCPQILVRPGA